MKYCKYCGKEIEEKQVCSCPESMQNIENRKKIIKIAIIAGVAILAAVLVLIICIACFDGGEPSSDSPNPSPGDNSISNGKIDPFEYIEVSFAGSDSNGEAIVYFKKESLISELIEIDPDADEEEFIAGMAQYNLYFNSIELSYSEDSNLSNGDVITVTVSVADVVRDKVKGGSKEYTVTGLVPITEVDLFDDVEVVYYGVSGNAYALINYITPSDILKACHFEFSSQVQLSNDDEITVSITNADYLKEIYNVIPKYLSKSFKVEGLPSYINSASQLPIDVIRQIASQLVEEEREEDEYPFSYGEIKIYGVYLMTEKSTNARYHNILKVIVFYDRYYRGEFNYTIYVPLNFYNILIGTDGTVNLTYEDGKGGTFTTDIDLHLSDYDRSYDVVKIEIEQ